MSIAIRTEYQVPAIRGPVGILVEPAARHQSRLGAVRPAGVHVEPGAGPGDEGEPIALRRPGRRIRVVDLEGEPPHVAAFAIHHVHLWRSAAVRGEGDLLSRRRPCW